MAQHYVAVRLAKPDTPSPLLCLVGPPGVGKTSLAWLVAAALGRVPAWVACGELSRAADVHGARSGPPGRIVGELRRVGVRNPVFILDGIDCLDEGVGVAAALREALAPMPGAAFRDRYVDLPFDLSDALFVATANRLTPVPAGLREAMTVVEVPGYTEDEKRAIAAGHLLPLQLARHGLTADQVRVTGEAVEAIVRGYTRETGVWGLADALGTVCAKVVRRRAEGDEAAAEVTPPVLAGMLGAPAPPEAKLAGRTGRPGVAVGLCWTAAGGDVLVVEASRMPGSGGLALTGRLGEMMQESAQVALSWLRANAERYGIDPAFPRDTDVHLHVSGEAPKEGASPGVTMAAALVSVFTGRPLRGGLAMTGEITLSGQVLPVGGIRDKVLAAAPLRTDARHPAPPEPPAGRRDARRRPPPHARSPLRDRHRRPAGPGAAARTDVSRAAPSSWWRSTLAPVIRIPIRSCRSMGFAIGSALTGRKRRPAWS